MNVYLSDYTTARVFSLDFPVTYSYTKPSACIYGFGYASHTCNYHAHHCSLPSKIALMWGREFVRPHRRKNNVGGTLHRYKGSFYIATIFFYRLYVYLNFKFYFTCMRMMITCPDFSDPAYISMSAAISNLEIAPPVVVWLSRLAHVMLSVAVVHLILDCEWWAKWCAYCLRATAWPVY